MTNVKNEEIAQEKAAQSPEDFEALSPEKALKTLHELQVHQIELEMQNEEMRRKQVELDAVRERYFDLYDLAPVGYLTISEKGLILEANLTATNLLGMARGVLVKQQLSRFILPDDQDIYSLHRKQLLETGAPQACELRVVKNDETTFWARLEATAAQDPDGEPACRVMISDITERKQADEALRESEANLREAQEIARIGRWELNLATNHLMWSDGIFALFEISHETFAASYEAFLEFIHPDDLSLVDRTYRESVERKTPYEIEHRLLMKDGRVKWVSEIGRTEYDDAGNPIRSVGTVQDITKRKRAEEKLQEVERLKENLERENVYLREEVKSLYKHAEIVGESKAIRQVLAKAEQVSSTNSTVLILGETGTGKELLAYAIHNMSNRKDRALVMVNCASLPPTLIESELFGREKGAYTGSLTKMVGRFELADESTLFLDEIGDLPLELQSKLLRVLEQGQFERLGSSRTIKVNVRLIAATNRDLAREVNEGRFRKDLYYRLNVFPITIPPLRDRKEDIPSLVWSFVKQFEKTLGKRIDSIPKKKMEALMHYPWPGNIRELRNVIEHAMIMSSTKTLDVEPPDGSPQKQSGSNTLGDMERRHIIEVLERTGWRISGKNGAAEILGMKRTTLQSKMKALGITRPVSYHK